LLENECSWVSFTVFELQLTKKKDAINKINEQAFSLTNKYPLLFIIP